MVHYTSTRWSLSVLEAPQGIRTEEFIERWRRRLRAQRARAFYDEAFGSAQNRWVWLPQTSHWDVEASDQNAFCAVGGDYLERWNAAPWTSTRRRWERQQAAGGKM